MLFIKRLSSDYYGFPFRFQTCHTALELGKYDLSLQALLRSPFPSPLHNSSPLLTQSVCPLADLYFIVSIIVLEHNFYAHPHPHPHLRHMCKWWSNLSFQLAAPTPTPTPSPTRTRTRTLRRPRVVARPRRLPPRVAAKANADVYLAWQFSLVFSYDYYYILSRSLPFSVSLYLCSSLCLFCTPLSFKRGGSSSTTPLRVASLKTKCRIMNRHVLHVREVL